MIVTANRLRSIGWLALLGLCAALVMVLSFRVNALKSEVRKSENRIVALRQEKTYLETEFETRANQQQLKAWNDLDFGYVAPTAGQYLESERQLAALGKPAGPNAPAPIRVASADDAVAAKAAFPALAVGSSEDGLEAAAAAKLVDHAEAAASLGKRLTLLESDDSALAAKSGGRSVDKIVGKQGRTFAKTVDTKASRKADRAHGDGAR